MNVHQIFEKLKSLKSKKDFQEFFIDLNFDYSENSDINLIDNFSIPSNLKEKIDFINLINEYKTFNIFYCKLKAENLYRNRANQRDIAKKVSRNQDCLIIFTNNDENIFRITYADFLERTAQQIKLSGYTISVDEKLRTASEQLSKIQIQADISILELTNKIKKSFEIEPVTEEFFTTIKKYIDNLSESYEKYFRNKHETKAFALQFFNRLLFLKYIEKKKWLNGNVNFLSELISKYSTIHQQNNKISSSRDSIYQNLLKPLFFYAFSKNNLYYPENLPESLIKELENLPFLNGGLFEKNELDLDEIIITNDIINGVLKDILNRYNFTVTEATPLDIEIAIDPEMLGLIYEGIVNEEERSGSGIFYTPRFEVDFMCKKSILHYLCSNTNISQDKLTDLIFGEASETDILSSTKIGLIKEEKEKILAEINDLNVLDPACGSGAFLIGMLQNILNIIIKIDELDLEELYKTEPSYLYNRKKELIEKIIHGVDIKPWAAQLAELRLWLYLIWDFETDMKNLISKPLLPSLDFKIRQGDSLISEIEKNSIILRNIVVMIYRLPDIYSRVDNIIDLKKKYYLHEDETVSKAQIESAEKELITHILNRKRLELLKKLNSYITEKVAEPLQLFDATEQQRLNFKLAEEKIRKEKEEIESELDRIDSLINNIGKIKEKDYFIWEIDFAEIFITKGGFDIIIGNPPYVRQEEIAPQLIEKEKITIEVKRDYKERLINNILNIYDKEIISRFDRKADYYVYFYFVCLSLLKNNGIFTFINSTSWLDVGYGAFLQEFLLKNFEIIDIHDNQVKRSFKSADINTIIISIQKPDVSFNVLDNFVKFVIHKVSFEESLNGENINLIYKTSSVINTNSLRIYPIKQSNLLEEGLEKEEDKILVSKYTGSKWGGKYLRAPDIYFTILEKGKGKLIPLKEISEVKRGVTTGANDFFYLDEMAIKKWQLEEKFLKNIITSPQESKKVNVSNKETKYKAFICSLYKKELLNTNALKYISWGERLEIKIKRGDKKGGKIIGYQNIETLKNRKIWYYLGNESYPDLIWNYLHADISRVFYNAKKNLVNNVLYEVTLKNERDIEIACLLQNSTLNNLIINILGRTNYGEGVLSLAVFEVEKIPVINPRVIEPSKRKALKSIFNNFINRELNSIFIECGFNSKLPIRSQNPNPLSDRKTIDDIVFDILNLTEDERKEVYWAVCELVKNRLIKATSF